MTDEQRAYMEAVVARCGGHAQWAAKCDEVNALLAKARVDVGVLALLLGSQSDDENETHYLKTLIDAGHACYKLGQAAGEQMRKAGKS
jgi:hypothetical protein